MTKKLYIIGYDISNAKRLRWTANLLEDYGVRIQNSVFYANLDDKSLEILRTQLMKIINENEDSVFVQPVCGNCLNNLYLIGTAENQSALRGLEGTAARKYFSVLQHNINPEWALFPNRSQHPPKSNVNAVLSFPYTLLGNYVETAILSFSLDSMMGVFHVCYYGSVSLVYDLMEEFRTPLCDTVCCSLFNLGILKENDFEYMEDSSVFLTNSSIRTVIKEFERKLQDMIYYEEEQLTYKEIIFEQVRKFRTFIEGKSVCYVPFAAKY